MKISLAFFAIILSVQILGAQSASISATNYSSAYANQTINQVAAYISQINQSSYLIFSPNLTGAYSNLAKAQQLQGSSPQAAVLYAGIAKGQAQNAYSQIGSYRSISFAFMGICAIFCLCLLYFSMMRPSTVNRK